MEEISIHTTRKNEIIDITAKVEGVVSASHIKEGICLVYAPHSTAAVLVMELDGKVENDVLRSLLHIVPNAAEYEHSHGPEFGVSGGASHGASHVKSALFGPSQSIPIAKGKLALGTWQSIAFCELDGPREDRRVFVQVVGR